MKRMKELTRAEEQVMKILWDLKKGFVKDIIKKMDPPKPAYTTVSTIIRILVKKEFVGYTVYGNTHEYYPLISKEEYKGFETDRLLNGYFDNSIESLVSFFVQKKEIKGKEAGKIMELLNDLKKE